MNDKILKIRDLDIAYNESIWSNRKKIILHNFNMELTKGEILGIMGNSGCGKSSLIKCITGITTPLKGTVEFKGKIVFDKEKDINELSVNKRNLELRKSMQIILQDPYESLDENIRVGKLIDMGIILHNKAFTKKKAAELTLEMLNLCGLSENTYNKYPHQLSGGERQRVCIARALVLKPDLLICDEISSALDTLIQAQILNLMLRLREKLGLTYIFVSHDMNIVKKICDGYMELGKQI